MITLTDFLFYFSSFLGVAFTSFFIFFKALNYKVTKKTYAILSLVLIAITATIIIFKSYNNTLFRLLFIFSMCTSFVISTQKTSPLITIPASIISVGISYSFQIFGTILVGIIVSIINNINGATETDTSLLGSLIITAIQVLLSVWLMRIKRFKNGFSFFKDKDNFGLGLIISGFIIAFVCIVADTNIISETAMAVMSFSALVSTVGLIMWIRRSIKKKYLEKLRTIELKKFEDEILEKDIEIDRLTRSNNHLAKIVHRDNHLTESLCFTINDLINSNKSDTEIKQALQDMTNLFDERTKLIVKEQRENKLLPSTNYPLIDGAMSNMLAKAIAHEIDFDINLSCDLHYIVNNFISQTQLETLLCDHIKDAIISVETSKVSNGKVLLAVRKNENIFEISISDNGNDFDIDVLNKLGIQKVTSHSKNGGTGTGFITTFDTLKSACASIIINEFKSRTPYTKSIVFKFDKCNKFIINSYRANELKAKINRTDLTILQR